jgi:hypothetical protein
MAQQTDTHGPTAALEPGARAPEAASERPPDHLSIFSTPALEVVSHWWLESNRRWTEQNGPKALKATKKQTVDCEELVGCCGQPDTLA